eukprot:scaffold25753_cov18-Prasinocladus_malaysianus.AAC.2
MSVFVLCDRFRSCMSLNSSRGRLYFLLALVPMMGSLSPRNVFIQFILAFVTCWSGPLPTKERAVLLQTIELKACGLLNCVPGGHVKNTSAERDLSSLPHASPISALNRFAVRLLRRICDYVSICINMINSRKAYDFCNKFRCPICDFIVSAISDASHVSKPAGDTLPAKSPSASIRYYLKGISHCPLDYGPMPHLIYRYSAAAHQLHSFDDSLLPT